MDDERLPRAEEPQPGRELEQPGGYDRAPSAGPATAPVATISAISSVE